MSEDQIRGNQVFAYALRALNRPLARRGDVQVRPLASTQGERTMKHRLTQHHRARRARVHRRRRNCARRRQGAALPVPRRRRLRELQLRADQRHRRKPPRAQGTDRPEPERDVRARREERGPRLVERRPARHLCRRPEAGRRRHRSTIRAKGGSSLADLLANPAATVADRGAATPARGKPLFLYVGTVAGGQSGGHISLHITSGNWRGLRSMLGQSPVDQTFTYDDGTIFLLWQGTRADRDRPVAAEGRRPHHGPRPRAARRDARAGRGDAGGARRRPRARRSDDADSS